jgi:hypothetical protein
MGLANKGLTIYLFNKPLLQRSIFSNIGSCYMGYRKTVFDLGIAFRDISNQALSKKMRQK